MRRSLTTSPESPPPSGLFCVNPGQVVLDNTMGSGTTGVACVQLGRRFIGLEQDDAHFGTAKQRIAEAISISNTPAPQIDLFEARA